MGLIRKVLISLPIYTAINQTSKLLLINQTSIAPISPAKPDSAQEVNGDAGSESSSDAGPRQCDIILVTGKPKNAEAAKEALLVSEWGGVVVIEGVRGYRILLVNEWCGENAVEGYLESLGRTSLLSEMYREVKMINLVETMW